MTTASECPKCNGSGIDFPYDPAAPRGSFENPYTRSEAIAVGIDVIGSELEAEDAPDNLVDELLSCKLCNGIGYIYEDSETETKEEAHG